MERIQDLALILKPFRYAEKDLIVIMLTENHGKVTAMAKNAVNSRRFGGALSFLSASNVAWVVKPNADLARIDEAFSRFEFTELSQDVQAFSVAGFIAEFCVKLIEPGMPSRELFLVVSNALHQLNCGKPPLLILSAFLTKALRVLGYAPNLTACGTCASPVDEVVRLQGANMHPDTGFRWDESTGSLYCPRCAALSRSSGQISVDAVLAYCDLLVRSFKEMPGVAEPAHLELYRVLKSFLHQQVPAVHVGGGLKSLKVLDESLLIS